MAVLYRLQVNDTAYITYKDKKYTAIELTDQLKIILRQENFGFIKDNIDCH